MFATDYIQRENVAETLFVTTVHIMETTSNILNYHTNKKRILI